MPETKPPTRDTAASSQRRKNRWQVFLLLFLLPFAARALPLDHGMPRGYVPDSHIVRNALGMAQTKDIVPPAGRFSAYPNLLPYALLPCYAVWYVTGSIAGSWESTQEFGDAILADPAGAHLIARWLVCLLGCLAPWVIFRAAQAAGLERGAWIAGLLVATGLLHAQFCTQERPWAPMATFMALSAWGAILHNQSGRLRPLLFSGLAAGLALATHQGGIGTFALCGLAWATSPLGWKGADLKRRLASGFACVGCGLALGLIVGLPHLLVHGFSTPVESVIGGADADLELAGLSFVWGFRLETLTRLSRVIVGYDPVLVLLLLIGLWPALRQRATLGLTLFLLLWAGLFMTNPSDHVRYLLPVTVLGAIPAGIAAQRILSFKRGQIVIAALLVFASAQVVRFSFVLSQQDTRHEAEGLLAEVSAGAVIAIDRYGPDVDLNLAALTRLNSIRELSGGYLGMREGHRAMRLNEGVETGAAGIDAIHIGELFDFDERADEVKVRTDLAVQGQTEREVLDFHQVTHLLIVERRHGGDGARLLDSLITGLEPEWVIDPRRAGSGPEAFLPTEMDFALTALWQTQRPGPRLELYKLR